MAYECVETEKEIKFIEFDSGEEHGLSVPNLGISFDRDLWNAIVDRMAKDIVKRKSRKLIE